MANLLTGIPEELDAEVFELLLESDNLRIERIISKGHKSPASGWYDQVQNEWVTVLQGEALLTFSDGSSKRLTKGDYLNIKAHVKHKVSWTDPEIETIWLAIHY